MSLHHPHNSEHLPALLLSAVVCPSSTTLAISAKSRIGNPMLLNGQSDPSATLSLRPFEPLHSRVLDHPAATCLPSSTCFDGLVHPTLQSDRTVAPTQHSLGLARPTKQRCPVTVPSFLTVQPDRWDASSWYLLKLVCPDEPDHPVVISPTKQLSVGLSWQSPELLYLDGSPPRSDTASPLGMTHCTSTAHRAVKSTLPQAQPAPWVANLRRTPESVCALEPYSSVRVYTSIMQLFQPDSLVDDPSSLRSLTSSILSPVLTGLPAAYSHRPQKLGHWYDLYHPASAGLVSVTNPIVSTCQATASSVSHGVQAHDKTLSRKVSASDPQLGRTRVMTLMWRAGAKDICSLTLSPFDSWTHEQLSSPIWPDPQVNPPHHLYESGHSREPHQSVMSGLPIKTGPISSVGQVSEPLSSSGQPVILSRSTLESACLCVLCRLLAAYTPTTTCFIDLAHFKIKLISSHDQLDFPAVPARQPLKLRLNGPYSSAHQPTQVEGQPSILTGDPTLNKGPGPKICMSNLQLGGTQIGHRNGVFHGSALSNSGRTTVSMRFGYDPSGRPPVTLLINGWNHELTSSSNQSNHPAAPLPSSLMLACWHVPHRSAAAHSSIIMHPVSPKRQRNTQSIGTGAFCLCPGHHSTQVEGRTIILINALVLDEDPSCGIYATNSHLGGTQIMMLMWLCSISYVKGCHPPPITSPIDDWHNEPLSPLAQPVSLTVDLCRPFESARLLEPVSSLADHLLTKVSLQLDPPADSLCHLIKPARLRVPGHSGVGELSSATHTVSSTCHVAEPTFPLAQMDHPVALSSSSLKPECSCPLCLIVGAGWSIMMNHICPSGQAVEPTPLSTHAGSLILATHSSLESAHLQSSHHSVATCSTIATRSTNPVYPAIGLASSYDWLDPPGVPACQLLDSAYLPGLRCLPVVHLLIPVQSTKTMCRAFGITPSRVHSDPPADIMHRLLELAHPYGLSVACSPLVMPLVSSAQCTTESSSHDQPHPPVIPVCCPLESADAVIAPVQRFSEQVHSQAQTQPEPELSRTELLQAQLSRTRLGPTKRIYAMTLCLETTGMLRAPPWYHPCEVLYLPDMACHTSKISWRSSNAAHPPAKLCCLKISHAQPKVILTAVQVLIQTTTAVSYSLGPTKDKPGKIFYTPLVLSGGPKPGELCTARSCANSRPRISIWHHEIDNNKILSQVVLFPAGRLNTTLRCHASLNLGRGTVALTLPGGSQWHPLQANCLSISASSTAFSDQLNPIVLLHPPGWFHYLIRRENSLPNLVHPVSPAAHGMFSHVGPVWVERSRAIKVQKPGFQKVISFAIGPPQRRLTSDKPSATPYHCTR
ncbi:uncharacterized protein EI90DRAFT_3021363 [Cantharellus anzutake]|uniref:uncharacterized protein n=1 Tax=Cantharellus anzutake TaxID=1750568 RepID=UPI0019049176|nr:uncharacterized protein EI90DRAFT_3021363 [Cantharellus anzutake]KAF8317288.1 hypothetical protein EI90DRAFT_3021363 [Cantharellus anzutake]